MGHSIRIYIIRLLNELLGGFYLYQYFGMKISQHKISEMVDEEKRYKLFDKKSNSVYFYTRLEWLLGMVLIFLAGFVEGIIFSYLFK